MQARLGARAKRTKNTTSTCQNNCFSMRTLCLYIIELVQQINASNFVHDVGLFNKFVQCFVYGDTIVLAVLFFNLI